MQVLVHQDGMDLDVNHDEPRESGDAEGEDDEEEEEEVPEDLKVCFISTLLSSIFILPLPIMSLHMLGTHSLARFVYPLARICRTKLSSAPF